VAIPLPDGTMLRADLYRPAAPGRYPVLLAWSPYTKELQNTGIPLPINEVVAVRHIVACGYVHLTVTARGTGRSGGIRSFQFDPREQDDVVAVIDWAAAQPWCDGKVGMAGMSYFAVIQYLAAAARPAHLTAIFPYLGWTDFYRHAVYHGGAPQSEFFSYYYSLVGATQRLRLRPGARHALGYLLDHGWFQWLGIRAFLPLRARLSAHLRPQESWTRDFVSLMFDHLTDGPFYRDKSPWPVLDRIEIPVCIGTNWGNPGLHMRGAFDAWRAVRGPKWLFIGPPDAHWPWENYQDELLAWYDWQLKGIDTGYERLPPVRYWLQGAGQWRSAADWPPPDAEPAVFHLAPRSASALDLHALGPAPPPSAVLSWLAVPPGMRIPAQVNRYEAQRVRYATPPFRDPVAIAGPVTLRLSLHATATDTHLIARMSDLAPDGRRRVLSFGWLQACYRAVDDARSSHDEIIHDFTQPIPLRPGQVTELSLSLTPTANLFRRGHRLLLEIGSRPDLLQATALENFVYFPYHAPPTPRATPSVTAERPSPSSRSGGSPATARTIRPGRSSRGARAAAIYPPPRARPADDGRRRCTGW